MSSVQIAMIAGLLCTTLRCDLGSPDSCGGAYPVVLLRAFAVGISRCTSR